MESHNKTSGHDDAPHGMSITVSIPAGDDRLYRYEATDGILQILADNPYEKFTFRELSQLVGYSHPAIADAVGILEANAIVTVTPEGNRKRVSIDRDQLTKPSEPVLRIPQSEFHAPVRTALDQLQNELVDVKGILVFGSVARGAADRQSDIDLWVLVQSDRATNQRRANEVGKELTETRFDGDRYEFQILVESTRSALNVNDRLTDVFASGITLYETETLRRFKREVRSNAE